MRGISFLVSPIPDRAFFEQSVFQGQLGNDLLQRRSLAAQLLHFVRGCSPRRIAGQALLASLEEVLRPAIIEVLNDPFAAAELRDAVLATQALQYDADLLFGGKLPPRRTADGLYDLLCRFLRRPGFLSHLRSLKGYDEPEILPFSIR